MQRTPQRLGRHEHLVDDDRRAVGAEHARDRVAVDVGVDDAHGVALLGERDGEVGGDARLADAALAGRDQQRPGLRAGLGERDRPALGVTVGLAVAGRRAGRAVQLDAQLLALLVGHHRELEVDVVTPSSVRERAADPVLDLVAQRAAGDGEGDEDVGRAVGVEFGSAQHAEVDDRAVQLGIFDRPECLDELLVA